MEGILHQLIGKSVNLLDIILQGFYYTCQSVFPGLFQKPSTKDLRVDSARHPCWNEILTTDPSDWVDFLVYDTRCAPTSYQWG